MIQVILWRIGNASAESAQLIRQQLVQNLPVFKTPFGAGPLPSDLFGFLVQTIDQRIIQLRNAGHLPALDLDSVVLSY